jgi:hypothetical protein
MKKALQVVRLLREMFSRKVSETGQFRIDTPLAHK